VRFLFATASAYPPEGPRLVAVGLGAGDELDAERLRVAAALAARRARGFEATSIMLESARLVVPIKDRWLPKTITCSRSSLI